MEFQINYGSKTLSPALRPDDRPLYASVDGRASRIANGEVVFYDTGREQTHVMTEQVLFAMDRCREFRPLDEQIARVAQALPALKGKELAVRRVLENLIARGLLISDRQYLEGLTASGAAPRSDFLGVFIRACDRPTQVKRLLASLLAYEQRFAPRRRYVLIDDSRDAANVVSHRELIRHFAEAAGVQAHHVDGATWNGVHAALNDAATDRAGADWLVKRDPQARKHHGGLAMNLISLLAAGRRYALLDDDFVFPLRLHPEADARADLDSASAMPVRMFDSLDAALEAGRDFEDDPLEYHLSACGAELGALINQHSLVKIDRDGLFGLAPSRLKHLTNARRIIATVNGHRGHSGAGGSGWLLRLDDASLEGLIRSREHYLAHLSSPKLWYGPMRARLEAAGNFTPFVVDATTLSPFTLPAGRGEDKFFGSLCRFLDPQGLTLHLPTAIGHQQEAERDRSGSIKHPFRLELSSYLASLVLSSMSEYRAADPVRRMHGLVARVRDMASGTDKDIVGELRESFTYVTSDVVQKSQQRLADLPQFPAYWQADLRMQIEVNGRDLAQPSLPWFEQWGAQGDEAACVANYRRDLEQLATALETWPSLWQAAHDRHDALWKLIG